VLAGVKRGHAVKAGGERESLSKHAGEKKRKKGVEVYTEP